MKKILNLIIIISISLSFFGFYNFTFASEPELNYTLTSSDFWIENTDNYQEIHMNGFVNLNIPGEPVLPVKTYKILVPPSAVGVDNLNYEIVKTVKIKGKFNIKLGAPIIAGNKIIEHLVMT